jgi:hypothetical protein
MTAMARHRTRASGLSRALRFAFHFALPLVFMQSARASEVEQAVFARMPVNVELDHVWSSGIINEGQPSTALHVGVSGAERLSYHSSLDFGFLEFDRRKYLRFNMVGFGFQPQTGREQGFDGFARIELLCLTVGETGYYALTPGLEVGATAHFGRDWALLGELRHSVDISNSRSSLTSILLGVLLAD